MISPTGELTLRTLAMPADANAAGDIFGGWVMAQMDLAGHWYPTAASLVIAGVLFTWSAYALSGAGLIRRLPMLRLILGIITSIFLLRGLGFYFLMPYFPGNSPTFWAVSSGICFAIGIVHLIGLRQTRPRC